MTDVLEVNFDKKHVSGDGLYMIAYPSNDDGCAWGGVRRFCRMPVSGLHIFEGDKWVLLNEGHRDMLVIGQVLNVYLFITKQGNPYGKEAFKTLWGAVRKKLGLAPREITFHDMRAKAASDSDSDESAQELLHHEDVKVTKRVYRRKVPTGTPLPSAIGGRGGD